MSRSVPDAQVEPTFDVALRRAIERRGLGLARLQERLRVAGHPVSQATLSYWQSGRSQPERSDSLRALTVLEEILELPAGSLRRLLVPARRRRRPMPKGDDPVIAAVLPQWPEMEDKFVHAAARTKVLSVHDDMVLDADRRSVQRIRVLERAIVDGLDRTYVYVAQEREADEPPMIEALLGCTVGELCYDDAKMSVIAELLLPEPLSKNETVVLEYAIHLGQRQTDGHERREIVSVREMLVSVTFHPDDLPTQVWQVDEVAGQRQHVPVTVRADGTVQSLSQDFGPGQTGLTWTWDPQRTPPESITERLVDAVAEPA